MVGRFLVHAEGPTLVERAPGAADADLSCFRDGPVAAAAALLRGEFPLRAASVSVGGDAVVLCGPAAAGKSALAAALAQRGHAVLADAVTTMPVRVDGERPVVTPVAPDPVLWPDSAAELGLPEAAGRRLRPALASRAYRLGPEPLAAPVAAVVVMRTNPIEAAARVEPLPGAARVQPLLAFRWHSRLADRLERTGPQLERLTRLARDVECVQLVRPRRGAPHAVLVKLVEGILA